MNHELVVRLPIDKLAISHQSKRYKDRNGLARLAINVRSSGVIQPIRVIRIRDGETYRVIAGGRRVLSLIMTGAKEAPCIVETRDLSEADILKLRWSENAQRVGMDPMEDARLVCNFMEASGLNGKETAKELGTTDTEVSRCRERVYEWCEELQQLVENGKVPGSTGHVIHAIRCPEKKAQALRDAANGQLTRAAATRVAKQRVQRSRTSTVKPSRRVTLALGTRGSVTFTAAELSLESLIASLEELSSKAKAALAEGAELSVFAKALKANSANQ